MNYSFNDIVITGWSAITAAGVGVDPLMALIRSGQDALLTVPTDLAGSDGYRWGKANGFKATDFIPPLKARKMDRCSQFAVAAAGLALKDAGIDTGKLDPERIGIALGCGFGGLANSAEFLGGYFSHGVEGLAPMLFPNTVANAPASNASIEHGLEGPNITLVQRFCSAETALLAACRFIAEGRADVMLAGGVDDLIPLMIQVFKATGQLRRFASCFGEGCGLLVLESADHAARRSGVVKGSALSVATIGLLVPGQEREALARLIRPDEDASLMSISGTVRDMPLMQEYISGREIITIEPIVGRSLAMGGTGMAVLLASLQTNQPGLHLAASPEGPYYAIRFMGGEPVQS